MNRTCRPMVIAGLAAFGLAAGVYPAYAEKPEFLAQRLHTRFSGAQWKGRSPAIPARSWGVNLDFRAAAFTDSTAFAGIAGRLQGWGQIYLDLVRRETALSPAIEKRIMTALKSMARELSSVPEEVRMLDLIPLGVESFQRAATIAQYFNKTILINRMALARTYGELAAQAGVPKDKLPEYTAAQFLPTLVHELRHAVNDTNLRGNAATLEEEVSGYAARVIAYQDSRGKFPEAYGFLTTQSKFSESLYQTWLRDGLLGVRNHVAKTYPLNPSIFSKETENRRKELADKAINGADKLEGLMTSYDAAVALCAGESEPEKCLNENGTPPSFDQLIGKATDGKITSRKKTEGVIADLRIEAIFWADESHFNRAKKYFLELSGRYDEIWKGKKEG